MTRPIIGLLITLTLDLLVAPLAADAQPAGEVHRIGWLHYGSGPSRRLGEPSGMGCAISAGWKVRTS